MTLKEITARILAYPRGLFSRKPVCGNPTTQEKPTKVTIVPTASTKAAMYRDWVMALCFGLFAGITVHDKFLKPNNADRVDTLIKSLDLNGDGHISKEELEKVKEFIKMLEGTRK